MGTANMNCGGGEDALNAARTVHRIGGSTCGLVGCVGSGCHIYTGNFVMSYFAVFDRVLTASELQNPLVPSVRADAQLFFDMRDCSTSDSGILSRPITVTTTTVTSTTTTGTEDQQLHRRLVSLEIAANTTASLVTAVATLVSALDDARLSLDSALRRLNASETTVAALTERLAAVENEATASHAAFDQVCVCVGGGGGGVHTDHSDIRTPLHVYPYTYTGTLHTGNLRREQHHQREDSLTRVTLECSRVRSVVVPSRRWRGWHGMFSRQRSVHSSHYVVSHVLHTFVD
jgi:hypothetical protein